MFISKKMLTPFEGKLIGELSMLGLPPGKMPSVVYVESAYDTVPFVYDGVGFQGEVILLSNTGQKLVLYND